jgi:hypothetical protein
MRAKGISYETGFVYRGEVSRQPFDAATVAEELRLIRDDLHCNAVRVIGGDPERLELAATIAADLGLEVWFSPYPLGLSHQDTLRLFADCAERAERIRQTGAEVVFVTGAELSLMIQGFLPGDTPGERVRTLLAQRELIASLSTRINDFLSEAAAAVRKNFHGRITYAAVPLERVDWTPFDLVSLDLYRTPEVAAHFAEGIRNLVAQGKPVAITEFGSATYRGAGDAGARGLEIVEYVDEKPQRLNGAYERDEEGQAAYIQELLQIFDAEGVDSAFLFTYALYNFPHRPDGDPRDDLDLASYGIVKVFEDGRQEPKAAFTTFGAARSRPWPAVADSSS